jgi:excisionase family DNA binding protein
MDQNTTDDTAIPTFLTPAEVAKICKVTPQTILNWERQGMIPSIRFGGMVRFDLEKVRDIVEKRKWTWNR